MFNFAQIGLEPRRPFDNLVCANLAQHPAFRTSGSDPCATRSRLNRSGISSRKKPKPRLKSFPPAKSEKHSSERPGSYEPPPKSINGFHRRSLSRRSKTALNWDRPLRSLARPSMRPASGRCHGPADRRQRTCEARGAAAAGWFKFPTSRAVARFQIPHLSVAFRAWSSVACPIDPPRTLV
jgi:hypothetical protein